MFRRMKALPSIIKSGTGGAYLLDAPYLPQGKGDEMQDIVMPVKLLGQNLKTCILMLPNNACTSHSLAYTSGTA
jgi:hypothetical protein